MNLVKVCDLEVSPPPGTVKEFKAGTLEVLVSNVDGVFFCTSTRCPHASGAPLSEGTLEGIILTCPWHESKFRVTDGQVLSGPANQNLIVYKTVVKDDNLFIEEP